MESHLLPAAALLLVCFGAGAQQPDANYDEAKVPKYTLPDPLVMANGERVRDAKAWQNRRRPEILELYRAEVFGRSPSEHVKFAIKVNSVDQHALGGKAVRKQVTFRFAGENHGPKMAILIYLPAGAKKPAPVFLGLSFAGNQTICDRPRDRAGRRVGARPGQQGDGEAARRGKVARRRGRAVAAREDPRARLRPGYHLLRRHRAGFRRRHPVRRAAALLQAGPDRAGGR